MNLFVKYIYIYVAIGEKNRETILSSLQVCFVIAQRERERERERGYYSVARRYEFYVPNLVLV